MLLQTILATVLLGGSIALLWLLRAKFPISSRQFNYRYKRKNYLMTRAERDFLNTLLSVVEQDYYVFAQVHLPTLLLHQIKGQSWQGALSHIDRKSVDFVICDRQYMSPKLAIELDDKTHLRPDRQLRDREVEQIFQLAGLPLLRIQNHGQFDPNILRQQLDQYL